MSNALSLGLAAHISWLLKLDEAQATKILEIVRQWSANLREGQPQFAVCESPAERLFLLGMLLSGKEGEPVIRVRFGEDANGDAIEPFAEGQGSNFHIGSVSFGDDGVSFDIYAQRAIADVRVDFAIEGRKECGEPGFWGIAIEIDGHEFHERTKEQASTDRKRDRDVQREGYRVARFTGSDVYRAPRSTVAEALEMADRESERMESIAIDSYEEGWNSATELMPALPANPKPVALLPASTQPNGAGEATA